MKRRYFLNGLEINLCMYSHLKDPWILDSSIELTIRSRSTVLKSVLRLIVSYRGRLTSELRQMITTTVKGLSRLGAGSMIIGTKERLILTGLEMAEGSVFSPVLCS